MKKPICFVAPVASSVNVQVSTSPSVTRSRRASGLFHQTANFLKTPVFYRFFLWNVCLAFGIIFQGTGTWAAPHEELYDAQGKRDPFVPLITATSRQAASGLIGVESLDEIDLQGIVFDPQNGSIVIVNDSLMKEGEEQGAVKVLKIEAHGALFSVNGIEGFKEQYQPDQPGQSQPRKSKS